MPRTAGCCAPWGERTTTHARMVAIEVAILVREHRCSSKVFNLALKNVKGFRDYYGCKGYIPGAVGRFRKAFQDDVRHWVECGYTDFEDVTFENTTHPRIKIVPSTTAEEKKDEDDDTDESSEFEMAEYEDVKKKNKYYVDRLEHLSKKKVRYDAQKRIEEIESIKAALAIEEMTLKAVLHKK